LHDRVRRFAQAQRASRIGHDGGARADEDTSWGRLYRDWVGGVGDHHWSRHDEFNAAGRRGNPTVGAEFVDDQA
jgi:hypothetical protein